MLNLGIKKSHITLSSDNARNLKKSKLANNKIDAIRRIRQQLKLTNAYKNYRNLKKVSDVSDFWEVVNSKLCYILSFYCSALESLTPGNFMFLFNRKRLDGARDKTDKVASIRGPSHLNEPTTTWFP